MNFSFALIARNESKTLPRLLASLSEYLLRGGKVIVLDTGSTDNTAEVARDLGCDVYEVGDMFRKTIDEELAKNINEKFIVEEEDPIVEAGQTLFDFASARNYVAELAPTDMIATPDCDEIRTKLDIDTICKLIDEGAEQFEYQFVFAHDYEGKPVIQFMHSKFYNRKKMHRKGIIHEVLQVTGGGYDVKRVYVDENVAKLEHYQNVETNRSGYLKGLAYDCYMNPDNDRNSHYFARELMYNGRNKSAVKEFERHIAMNKWPTERAQSMIFIGDITGDLERYRKSHNAEPNRREPLMKLADHYYQQGDALTAIMYATAALQIPLGNFYANYAPYYTNYPHEILYWAYRRTDRAKSKEHFDLAFSYEPNNPRYIEARQFYYPEDYPLISFVIPTRGERPEGMEKCVKSIGALTYNNTEVIVIDNKEETCPQKTKKGVQQSKGERIVFASDDMEFAPESVMNALNYCKDNDKLFVAFNTGPLLPDEGNICEHFMIHRSIIPNGDEIFDCEFNHVGVDNLLRAQMRKIDQAGRCDNAIIHHHHWSRTGKEMDETYKVARDEEKVKKDRALLEKKLAELQ